MTKASEILATARDCSEGMDLAEKFAVETDQDWYNESTSYTFEDGTVLLASGSLLKACAR